MDKFLIDNALHDIYGFGLIMIPAQQPSATFKNFLQQELLRRCKSNRQYSLRAFARQLEVEPSYLSKILRGQRNVSSRMFLQMSQKIGLSPAQVHNIKKSTSFREQLDPLAEDQFHMIADWYHFAILELSLLENFQNTAAWISYTLNISFAEAQTAIQRLERLGFITTDPKSGRWRVKTGLTTTMNTFTNTAFRKMQHQILALASQKMEEVPFERRDQSSMTMAIRRSRIPEAKKMIRNFRRKLMKHLQEGKKKDDLYILSISLFPGTQLPWPKPKARKKTR